MKTILRTIYWYLHFAITLILMHPSIKRLQKEKSQLEKIPDCDFTEFDEEVFRVSKEWASKQLKAAGVNVIVTGAENIPKENVLFVSNHEGNFDIPTIMTYVEKPKGFIAKKSIEKIPIVNEYMLLMHSLFIERDNVKEAGKVILESIKLLKSGTSLVIFPEGTRSKSSQVSEFKDGAFKIATKASVPIVPISIFGTYKVMEENNNKIVGQTVRLCIHKPISTAELSKEEIKELPAKVRKIIEDTVIEYSQL